MPFGRSLESTRSGNVLFCFIFLLFNPIPPAVPPQPNDDWSTNPSDYVDSWDEMAVDPSSSDPSSSEDEGAGDPSSDRSTNPSDYADSWDEMPVDPSSSDPSDSSEDEGAGDSSEDEGAGDSSPDEDGYEGDIEWCA